MNKKTIIHIALYMLISIFSPMLGMRKQQPTPPSFDKKLELLRKEKERQDAYERLLTQLPHTKPIIVQQATIVQPVAQQQQVRYTPKTKKPFQTISALIPDEHNNRLTITTETNNVTPFSLFPKDIQNIHYIFENNPTCTVVYVKIPSENPCMPHIFAINKQPLLAPKLAPYLLHVNDLEQETAQTTLLAIFAAKLTHSTPHTPRKKQSIAVKDIRYFTCADENSDAQNIKSENEIVFFKDIVYLKKYSSNTILSQLNGLKETDITFIHTIYQEQSRANVITNEVPCFTLETNEGTLHTISYITCDNKTVSLGNPVQTITPTADTLDENYTLHIDPNNIVTLHNKDSQISLVQCTKNQLNYIKNSTIPLILELPDDKHFYIDTIHRNNCVYELAPTTEFTLCFNHSQPTELYETITHITPNTLTRSDDFSAVITIALDEDTSIPMPYIFNKSQIYEIATLLNHDKELEQIYFYLKSDKSYQRNIPHFSLERTIFEQSSLAKITHENLTREEQEAAEKIVAEYVNRQPKKPEVRIHVDTEILTPSTTQITPDPEKIESPDQAYSYKHPFIIGGISVTCATLLACILYHYSDALYELFTKSITHSHEQ